jgi:DNA-binding NarL/FixJ family response regulator
MDRINIEMTMSSRNSDAVVRVAYFDDQLLFREALVSALDEGDSIAVVRSSGHGSRDIRALLDVPISVILASLDGQTNDPLATVREARHIAPELPICALVAVDRLERAREALALGCKGAVSTSATLTMLISALENVAHGQAFVDPTLGGRLLAKSAVRVGGQRDGKNGSRHASAASSEEVRKT